MNLNGVNIFITIVGSVLTMTSTIVGLATWYVRQQIRFLQIQVDDQAKDFNKFENELIEYRKISAMRAEQMAKVEAMLEAVGRDIKTLAANNSENYRRQSADIERIRQRLEQK